LSGGRKKEIYPYIRFFHGALQLLYMMHDDLGWSQWDQNFSWIIYSRNGGTCAFYSRLFTTELQTSQPLGCDEWLL